MPLPLRYGVASAFESRATPATRDCKLWEQGKGPPLQATTTSLSSNPALIKTSYDKSKFSKGVGKPLREIASILNSRNPPSNYTKQKTKPRCAGNPLPVIPFRRKNAGSHLERREAAYEVCSGGSLARNILIPIKVQEIHHRLALPLYDDPILSDSCGQRVLTQGLSDVFSLFRYLIFQIVVDCHSKIFLTDPPALSLLDSLEVAGRSFS